MSHEYEYDIKTIPDNVVLGVSSSQGFVERVEGKLVWTGSTMPPPLGTRVRIRFNDLGTGTVASYFHEYDYFGVCIKLDSPPEWHKKQNNGRRYEGYALVFGLEIDLEPQ